MAKDYSQMNKEELLKEVEKLQSRKSYGIVWEDKAEDVVEKCKKDLPILIEDEKRLVENDPDEPSHLFIEGDNYHALAVLSYTHKKSIDVIYIDPPYNTGAKDWKYNNHYVDETDAYRHSKWLSMMAHRLKLAKKLLRDDGVLVCAIDDNEVHHLRVLIEEIMPTYDVACVTVVQNPRGNITRNFARTHEYALFVIPKGVSAVERLSVKNEVPRKLRRWGHNSLRTARPTMFYPIYVKDEKVVDVGEVPDKNFHPEARVTKKNDLLEIWPIDQDGIERRWNFSLDTVRKEMERIEPIKKNGEYDLFVTREMTVPKTVWNDPEFEAGRNGATLVREITGTDFPYPKSIFTVYRVLEILVKKKENAIILDFFAGSGTTGHAVMKLNVDYPGKRKFILATNNEGNIAHEVCYPRVKNVINGYKKGKDKIDGLGGNLHYYKTDFITTRSVFDASDEEKIKLTYEAGRMIALREDTLEETEKNDWWQIFTDKKGKTTAIYFKEDKEKLNELIEKINSSKSVALYIFSWGKNEYKNEYTEYKNIRVEDIPEPILEVYKEINKK